MKSLQKIMSFIFTALMVLTLLPSTAIESSASNMYKNSDFIETEQPTLSEETKRLISLYQKNPTEENYLNLREIVIENYNAVLDRKEAKLAELRAETAGYAPETDSKNNFSQKAQNRKYKSSPERLKAVKEYTDMFGGSLEDNMKALKGVSIQEIYAAIENQTPIALN